MIRLIRVESLKLRTTRLTYGLLALAAGLTALDTLLRAARAGNGRLPPLDTASGLARPLTVTGFAMLMAWVLGITVSSGEFRHNTATLTYLSFPHRARVLVAKAVGAFGAGMIFGAVGATTATGVSIAFVFGHGYRLALPGGTIARDAAGAVFGAGLLAAVGVALGSLIRAQIGAVIGAFVWAFVVETVVGGLFNSIGPYLPFTAATTLAGSPLGGGGFGFSGSSTATPLRFAVAAALVAGVALLISVVAAKTTLQRDIS
jgi:ABC-2 type transport system permease protein